MSERHLAARGLLWAAVATALVFALLPHPPSLPIDRYGDKVEHMLAFATLALLAPLAYPATPLPRLAERLSFLGALIEVGQSLPSLHRDCDLRDWVADTAAVLVVLVGYALARRLTRRAPEPAAPPLPATAAARDSDVAATDAVLDAFAEPVLIVEDGRVLIANRAALALLGRHIVGQDARLAIRHPDAAAAYAASAPPTGEPVLLEGLGALDQLWQMRVAATATGLRVVHLSDRSAGRAADRMRTDFVANASHELRTPLASILGYVETLQGEAGDEAPVRVRFLQIVFDEASRMQRLVQDLLSLSRIEADRFRLPGQRVALDALVEQVAIEARADSRLVLEVAIDEPLPAIVGDAPQLSQLLHNLIGNARAYGRAGAPVAVAARNEGGGVRLSVTDQGEGIPAEHLPRLTERFYRVDAARSRAASGTGLGLAIVKHIVERHRGRLGIDSQVGIGTTVSAWFPAAEEAVTEA